MAPLKTLVAAIALTLASVASLAATTVPGTDTPDESAQVAFELPTAPGGSHPIGLIHGEAIVTIEGLTVFPLDRHISEY